MSNPPTVSLSQQPIQSTLASGETLVIHSAAGFKRLDGEVITTLVANQHTLAADLEKLAASLPGTMNGLYAKLSKELHDAMAVHRHDAKAHEFTKAQIGLGKVENFGVASLAGKLEGYVLASDVRQFIVAKPPEAPKSSLDTESAGLASRTAARFRAKLGTSVALGHRAAMGGLFHAQHFVAIGAHAEPIADSSITLGSTASQLYLAKPPATRADQRDFTEIKQLDLGLDFLLHLTPVTAVADLREDYVDYAGMPVAPVEPAPMPKAPELVEGDPGYLEAHYAHQQAHDKAVIEWANYQRLYAEWKPKHAAWLKANQLDVVARTGEWKAKERRSLIMASDLRRAAQILTKTFTGLVNETEATQPLRGLDIDTVRMEELIPVVIKAIQELHAYLASDAFADGVAEKIYLRKRAARG